MSAQETVSGQAFSTAAFTLSTKPKPRSVWFGCASFSAVLFAESSRTDPSHPYIHGDQARCSGSRVHMHANADYPDEAVVEVHPEERPGEAGRQ
mgnify:CR=1 FL=1